MKTHDIVAIGCGPFNLGLAALASTVPDLDVVVLDRAAELSWHPGLMLDDARLQVSFLADLVSLVSPTHPLSFLSYLASKDRLYPFYIREQFHMTRREYEDYLRWAASQLETLRFRNEVRSVEWDAAREVFTITAETPTGRVELQAEHVVVGIGTQPFVAPTLRELPEDRILHTGHFLPRIDDVTAAARVTVVGSGQSGAEVVLELLRRKSAGQQRLSWLTRTASFAPLDYTKLVLEMTTPTYVDYFHELSEARRDELVASQWRHYKGISGDTLAQIHDVLYARTVEEGTPGVEFRCGTAVSGALVTEGEVRLQCRHADTGASFEHSTDLVIAATGYRHREPDFLSPLEEHLERDGSGRFRIERDHAIRSERLAGRIFVANADLHSHGVAAPDLGICAVRNATILNRVARREVYALPRKTAFTSFELPPDARRS